MKTVSEALPKFVGLKEFFRRLGRKFTPVKLDDESIRFYCEKIRELKGFPEDYFFNIKWAWCADPHFREARKYASSLTMVRIGVGMIGPGLGLVRDSQNLLMAFGKTGRLLFYTLICGNGKFEKGVEVYGDHDWGYAEVRGIGFETAKDFVKTMVNDDFLVLKDTAHPWQYFQALAGTEEDGRITFAVEYSFEDFVFQFELPEHIGREELLQLITILEQEGFAGLQEAGEWWQVDVEGYWKYHLKRIDVDVGLLAHIYQREALQHYEVAAWPQEAYNTRTKGEKSLVVYVNYGTREKMLQALSAAARDEMRFTPAQQLRIKTYIELERRRDCYE